MLHRTDGVRDINTCFCKSCCNLFTRSIETDEMKELKEKFEYLLKRSKRETAAHGDVAEVEDDGVWCEDTEKVSYIQGNYQNRSFNQNIGTILIFPTEV